MVNAPQFCFKDIIVYETSYVRHIKLKITVSMKLKHPWIRNEGPFLSLYRVYSLTMSERRDQTKQLHTFRFLVKEITKEIKKKKFNQHIEY